MPTERRISLAAFAACFAFFLSIHAQAQTLKSGTLSLVVPFAAAARAMSPAASWRKA